MEDVAGTGSCSPGPIGGSEDTKFFPHLLQCEWMIVSYKKELTNINCARTSDAISTSHARTTVKCGISKLLQVCLLKRCLGAAATPRGSLYICAEALPGMEKKDSDHMDIVIMWWDEPERTVFDLQMVI